MRFWAMLSLISLFASILFARTGGPDLYGYTFIDSDEPSVEFSWIDYGSATEVTIPADSDSDDVAILVHLPFPFTFYGEIYDSLWVSTNGLLAFVPNSAEHFENVGIPNSSLPNGLIAPLWDDQRYYDIDTVETAIYYLVGGEEPERWLCISWVNFFHYGFTGDTWTYQAILYEQADSSDGMITFQYLDLNIADLATISYGASATVGIENESGTIGLQYSFNEAVLSDSLRIDFHPPEFLAHDVAAIGIIEPRGVVISERDNIPRCILANMGTSDEATITVNLTIIGDTTGEVYNADGSAVMLAGDVDTIEFLVWTAFPADSYTVIFSVNLPGDENPSNDTVRVRVAGRHHIGYGGPDVAGYMWYDNLYSGVEAPEFVGIDLTDAVEIDIYGDDDTISLALPFSFPFYGERYDRIWISTNGVISFGPFTSSHYNNLSLPTTVFSGIVAPFWDDLNIQSSVAPISKIYTRTEPNKFHIIYLNAYVPPLSTTDYLTFEIVLSDDGEIVYQYTGLHGSDDPERVFGNSATVGISSPDGSSGLMYEYNGNPLENPIFNDFAIRFVPPVDTVPPLIVHTPDSLRYLCASDSFSLNLVAQISDTFSGVAVGTLYYYATLLPSFATPDTVIDNTYYFTLLGLTEGESFTYYIVAWDSAGNRSILPYGAPDERFETFIGNPHNGENDFCAFSDNFADETSYPVPPEFEWIELDPAEGGVGTEITGIEDDWLSDAIPVSSPIWHTIGLYSFIKICSNGWITFDTSETTPFPFGTILDSSSPNDLIAALWTNLTPVPPDTGLPYGRIFYGYIDTTLLAIGGMLIVEWKDFYFSGDISGESATFQVKMGIFEHSWGYANFEASVHYLSVPFACSGNVTIGIENNVGDVGLAYINDGFPDACLPTDSSAVDFYNLLTNISEKMTKNIRVAVPYPNPFNSVVNVVLNLPEAQYVYADVISINGKRLERLQDGILSAGNHSIRWFTKSDIPSGIYFIRIRANGEEHLRRVLLVR